MGLIYDFYGFPPHYYDFKYPNKGSPELAQKVLDKFQEAGIKAEGVRRGLDHGVWASFMCAFDPENNPLNVPIVQVSLFDSEDPDKHYRLGQAVASLRDEGVLIIVSGMSVHNLRDMWRAHSQPGPLPYAVSFDEALREAVEQAPEKRQKAMAELLRRPDARRRIRVLIICCRFMLGLERQVRTLEEVVDAAGGVDVLGTVPVWGGRSLG